jgi:hypothetical protein
VLTVLDGSGNEHESLLDLLTYLGENEEYKVTWEEAMRSTTNGLVLPTLDGAVVLCNMNKSC